LSELATHIVSLPRWGALTLDQPDFDITTPAPGRIVPREPARHVHTNVAATRSTDKRLRRGAGGDVEPEDRRRHAFHNAQSTAIRTFFLNHVIHHRGQLTVYLWLTDVPLPQSRTDRGRAL
jgi:hypothetical protein